MIKRPSPLVQGAFLALLATATATPKSLDPPKRAGEHKVGPAYVRAPQPELNPWADKGIPVDPIVLPNNRR